MLGRRDCFGRLRVYTPVTAGGQPIYVHAKIMSWTTGCCGSGHPI